MTGIERLRKLIEDYRTGNECDGIVCEEISCGACIAKNVLKPIIDQIEREQVDAAADHAVVASVITDMERHALGHEGMDDSPVARWARELRQALGGRDDAKDVSMSAYDLLSEDDREAVAWVREHGGLSHVKDIYHDFRAVVERLGIEWSESELHGLMDALDRRLMPEGMEWPRYEDGGPVRCGDEALLFGRPQKVGFIQFFDVGVFLQSDDSDQHFSYGERVKRPAPKVLAGDDKPLTRGEHVWHEDGTELRVLDFLHEEDDETLVKVERVSGPTNWSECRSLSLTHERPDSWERLEEDATMPPWDYCEGHGLFEADSAYKDLPTNERFARDLVRRAKALAGDA